MNKNILKSKQGKVFTLLENALKKNRLAHVYLFVGSNNEFMLETGEIFLSSIIEGNNDFFTDENLLRRVRKHSFVDYQYLDNSQVSIKVDDIRNLIESFQKTAIESYEKKIYILNNFDNVSNVVANALLKFIEEPSNDTYGIIIINNKDNVLDTIKSRCQIINFEESKFVDLYEANIDIDDPHSYLLARLKIEDKTILEDEVYQIAYEIFLNYLDEISDINAFTYYLHSEIFNNKLETKLLKNSFKLFIQMTIIILNDSLLESVNANDKYLDLVNGIKNKNINVIDHLEIFLDILKDFESISFDYRLVAEKMCYLLKGV